MTTAVRSTDADLRSVSRRKAHRAAMRRAIDLVLQQSPLDAESLRRLTLRDLPEGEEKIDLLRHRFALGFSNCPNSRVLVDDLQP